MREKSLFSRVVASVAALMTVMSTVCTSGAFENMISAAAETEIIEDENIGNEPVAEELAETANTEDDMVESENTVEDVTEEEPEVLAVPTAVMRNSGNADPVLLADANDGIEGDDDVTQPDPVDSDAGEPTPTNVTYELVATPINDYQAQADAALKAVSLRFVSSKMIGVNKDDDTETNIVRVNNDFTVAYSMSINTAHAIKAGALNVRIPRKLFTTRDGASLYVTEDGIGVDAFPITPTWSDEEGKYIFDEDQTYYVDSDAFINYFYDAKTDEYVFVNYQDLSYANQPTIDLICYGDSVYTDNKIHIFDIKDNTDFSITAQGYALYEFETEVELVVKGDDGLESPLTGTYYVYEGSDGKKYYEKKGDVLDGVHTLYQFDGFTNALTEACKMEIDGDGKRKYYTIQKDTEIVDGQPVENETKVQYGADDFELTQQTEKASTDKDSNTITGKIDTYAKVTQASKELLKDNRINDGSITNFEDIRYYLGLDNSVDITYLSEDLISNGSLNTTEYYFTAWKITTIGECTQPFDMNMTEEPMVWDETQNDFVKCDGAVVIGMSTQGRGIINSKQVEGVDENNNPITDTYFMMSCDTADNRTKYNLTNVEKDKGFKSTHYAVVAYPLEKIRKKDGDTWIYKDVKNNVTATLYPDDDQSSTSISSADGAAVTVLDNPIDIVEIKGSDLDKKGPNDNNGWLTIYDFYNMNDQQSDMGDFVFTVSGATGVYGYTHGGADYHYINGTYVKMIAADDIIIAEPVATMDDNTKVYKDAVALDGNDYYYSRAELTLIDKAHSGVRETNTETADFDNKWHVYVMYNDDNGWVEYEKGYTIDEIEAMDNKLVLDFAEPNQPYRIQVRHNAIDDSASVNMNLTMQIRGTSPKLKSGGELRTGLSGNGRTDVNADGNNSGVSSFKIKLTNYGSITAAAKNYGFDDVTQYAATGKVEGSDHLYQLEPSGTYKRAKENGTLAWYAVSNRGTTNSYKSENGRAFNVDGLDSTKEHIADEEENITYKNKDTETTYNSLMDITQYKTKSWNLTTIEQKADAYKSATSKNSRSQSRVNITYTLSGYEGYALDGRFSQIIEDLIKDPTNNISHPQREYVIFKDLLPQGVEYDGTVTPKIGKLLNTEISGESFSANTSEMAIITDTDVQSNWEGTGRTMVTFKVRILDPDAVIANNALFVGTAIQFGAYVSWTMYDAAREQSNIFAYVANDTKNNGDLWGGSNRIQDNGTPIQIGDYAPFSGKEKFDDDDDTAEFNRVYAKENSLTTVPGARSMGISKSVRADDDKYAPYSSRTGVIVEHFYTYRIKLEHSGETVNNVKIWDFLEDKFHEWQGTPQKIMSSDLPVGTEIFIYTGNLTDETKKALVPDTALTDEQQRTAQRGWTVLQNTNTLWTKYATVNDKQEIVPETGVDFKTAKAVMIEFEKSYLVEENSLYIVDIRMQAPNGENGNGAVGRVTCNEPWYYGDVAAQDSTQSVGGRGNVTTVTLGKQVTLEAEKKVVGNYVKDGSLNTEFTFQLKRVLREYEEKDNIPTTEWKQENLANIQYELLQNGNPIQTNIVHTTDSDGRLTLKPGQSAKFSSIVGFGALNLSDYTLDFQNYSVSEAPSPYWYTENDDQGKETDNGKVVVKNYYRPVLFITKQITGAPDNVDTDQTFQFHLRINETEKPTTGKEYTFSSEKGTAADNKKLYAYSMTAPSSVHAEPSNWTNISTTKLVELPAVPKRSSVENDFYYEFEVKAGETLAIPIYIDGGMLDYRGNPKYYFSVEEVAVDFNNNDKNYDDFKDRTYDNGTKDENETSPWQPENILLTGKLGGTDKTDYQAAFNNYYKYRTLLLKKSITNAYGKEMSGYAFHFRLTGETEETQDEQKVIKYEPIVDTAHPVGWELWETDSSGNPTKIVTVDEQAFNGVINTETGEFVVPMCGVASTGYIVKLTNVPAGKTLKVEEVLDKYADLEKVTAIAGNSYDYSENKITIGNKGYTLATTDMFKAVKGSEKTLISLTGNVSDKQVNLINDYQRRDLSLEKIVASDEKPNGEFKVQVWSDHSFRYGNKTATEDKNGTNRPEGIPSSYQYYMEISLKSGVKQTIQEIGVVDDTFYIYEVPDTNEPTKSGGFNILSDNPQSVKLSDTDSVTGIDIINGDPGKIIIKKQYTGAYGSLDETNKKAFDKENITLELSIDSAEKQFKTPDLKNLSLLNASGDKYADDRFIPSLGNDGKTIIVTMRGDDTLIVDAVKLSNSAGFTQQQPIKVKETSYTESLTLKDASDKDVFYTISPEKSEWTTDTVRTLIKNKVSSYTSAIYKRIAGNFPTSIDKLYNEPFTMQITDEADNPIAGVGYLVEFHKADPDYPNDPKKTVQFIDMSSQGVTDNDGRVTVRIPNGAVAWEETNGTDMVSAYYFKVYFDGNVKINPTAFNGTTAYSVTELMDENSTDFGKLVGYETFGTDILNYDKLNAGSQWQTNADTFVNSVDTTPVRVTKKVHPADGVALTADEKNLEFTFTVKDIVNGEANLAPGISYKLYGADGNLISKDNVTDNQGRFTLKHGQTAILDLPSYKFWRIDEVADSDYRLYTKNGELVIDGKAVGGTAYELDILEGENTTYGESLAANQTAVDKNNAAEEGGGYTLNSGLNLNKIYGDDAIIRSLAVDSGVWGWTNRQNEQDKNRSGMEFFLLKDGENYDYKGDSEQLFTNNNIIIGGKANSVYPIGTYESNKFTGEDGVQAIWNQNGEMIWCSKAYYNDNYDPNDSKWKKMHLFEKSTYSVSHYFSEDFVLWIDGDDKDYETRDLILPEEICVLHADNSATWHKVTGISNAAASDIGTCKIRKTNLIGSSNLKAIGKYAFFKLNQDEGYGIQSVTLNGIEYIGENAFRVDDAYGNFKGLKSISINGNGAILADHAFHSCQDLSSISLKGINRIGVEAFVNAAGNNTGGCVVNIVGDGAENSVIKLRAFKGGTYLKTVNISNINTLTGAGHTNDDGIFRNCNNLETVTLTNVGTVGKYAFYDCKKVSDVRITNAHIIEVAAFQISSSFSGSGNGTLVIIGDGEEGSYIGTYAFINNSNFKTADISNINEIKDGVNGSGAFQNCSNLETITLRNINKVGNWAFGYCSKVKTITATNVYAIGKQAFQENKALATVTITGIHTIGEQAFDKYNADRDTSTYSPNNKITIIGDGESGSYIGKAAFRYCKNMAKVDISGIEILGTPNATDDQHVFANCTNLSYVEINDVSLIGRFSFQNCFQNTTATDNYLKINGSNSDDSLIREGAFGNCSNLNTIIITNIKTLGSTKNDYNSDQNVFKSCKNVTSITLSGVETIDKWAFVDSESISYARITGVKNIMKYAFETAYKTDSGYHTMYVDGNDELVFGEGVFKSNDNKIKALVLPNGKITMGNTCITKNIMLIVLQTDSKADAIASTLTFNGGVNNQAYLVYKNLDYSPDLPTFGFSNVLYRDTLNQTTANQAINAAGGNTAIHPDVVALLGGTTSSPRPPYKTAPQSELFVAYQGRRDDET